MSGVFGRGNAMDKLFGAANGDPTVKYININGRPRPLSYHWCAIFHLAVDRFMEMTERGAYTEALIAGMAVRDYIRAEDKRKEVEGYY